MENFDLENPEIKIFSFKTKTCGQKLDLYNQNIDLQTQILTISPLKIEKVRPGKLKN